MGNMITVQVWLTLTYEFFPQKKRLKVKNSRKDSQLQKNAIEVFSSSCL